MGVVEGDLALLRARLVARAEQLRAEVQRAGQGQLDALASEGHEVTDRKDEAATRIADEISAAEEQRDRAELERVEAALARIAAGAYGICSDCEDRIALPRLIAQPAAERCASCESAREARSS